MFTKTASLTFQQGQVFARLVEEEEKKDEEVKDGAKPATTSAVAAGTRPGGAVGAT